MNTLYVFKSQELGSIAISAANLKDAMKEVEEKWYPSFFNYSFSVDIVGNTSGIWHQT